MPIMDNKHQVHIRCGDRYPSEPPEFKWLTPVWHPNIQHEEPKDVCIDAPKWTPNMRLEGVCRFMFQMIQYQNYHAALTPPYPLDLVVAKWVRDFAEPRGIVGKNKPVDDKLFYRPSRVIFEPNTDVEPLRIAKPPKSEESQAGTRRLTVRFGE
jgi:hypothetical protein